MLRKCLVPSLKLLVYGVVAPSASSIVGVLPNKLPSFSPAIAFLTQHKFNMKVLVVSSFSVINCDQIDSEFFTYSVMES